jgi:hypothetical protein
MQQEQSITTARFVVVGVVACGQQSLSSTAHNASKWGLIVINIQIRMCMLEASYTGVNTLQLEFLPPSAKTFDGTD